MGFHITLYLLLFAIPRAASMLSHDAKPDTQAHLQNVYPGCKSSPDQPDMSYPECNRTSFLQQISAGSPEFGTFFINSTSLTKCFNNSSEFVIHSAVEGLVEFETVNFCEHGADGCRESYHSCVITLVGPPGTCFRISTLYHISNGGTLLARIEDSYENTRQYYYREDSTVSNVLTFSLDLFRVTRGAIAFAFRFQALVDCQRQLQISCLSATNGFIETPGWTEGNPYLNNMHSCVTLHVPENHVTMISLVSIDLELKYNGRNCHDYLEFYQTENCTGPPETTICQTQDLTPTVIQNTHALSFRFVSDFRLQKTGFRLLYSFHHASEQPLQLAGGKWDCSLPYYDSFQQHFTCIAETLCSDRRDKVACPENDLCGPNLVRFGGSCYRVFEPSKRTTWTRASEICGSYGSGLAVVNGAVELKAAIQFVKEAKVHDYVFIGLRMTSSVRLNEMYQNTWMWSDDTLAVYLPLTFDKVDPPYCAALKGPSLIMVSCNKNLKAAFICETDFTPEHDVNDTGIFLTSPSNWSRENDMTICPHGHITHTFLACDVSTNCSAANQAEISACSSKFSPVIPFFTCRNQLERVPYTLVCDFRSDCCDGSDEDFCEYPGCESSTEYECADGRQCISRELVCNKRSDCVDSSDEVKCWDTLSSSELWANTMEPPAKADFTDDGNFHVTRLTSTTCPETHFQCPDGGYCLPVYVRCNEFYDCPGKEDEMDCDHYTCPGFYRCRKSKICVHEKHLCDGVFQCPQHDDERMCDFTCPVNCHCHGHAFICTGPFTANDYPELRYVDASGTGMKPEDFMNNSKLVHVSLRNNDISMLRHMQFPNLLILDLSFNNIRELESDQIVGMNNLKSLSLACNFYLSFDSFLHHRLTFFNLININLFGIKIPERSNILFTTIPNVKYLNISNSGLTKLTKRGFQSLNHLRVLDLRGCPIETFFPGIFKGLNQLEVVYANNYKLCCSAVLPQRMDATNCHAPSDEISSCDALLKKDIFRVCFAFYAILALTGNAGSFVYHVTGGCAAKLAHEMFVIHLTVADFLMGIWLAIVGIADLIYHGNYLWHDLDWRGSVTCKLAGFLSLVSSEVSAFLISLITLERVLVIGFPHKSLRFNRMSAHAASMAVWLLGLVLALVPLLPFTSHWDFYSQSGICAPLPITMKQYDGSDYAFSVLIVLNFGLFLFVAAGQLLIHWTIRVNAVCPNDPDRKPTDTVVAWRLLAVVMTNFLCWFPIGLLGITARSGVPLSGEMIAVIAIFILPFNSALNPFLYTLNVMMERRRKIASARKYRAERETLSFQNRYKIVKNTYSKEEAFQLFKRFLDNGLLTPEQIRQNVWDSSEG